MKTYQKIFLFAILICGAISLIDIFSMNSGIFGNPENYTNGIFSVNGWWSLFFKFNLLMIALLSLSYFWFGNHDFSESLSLFAGVTILWLVGGISDILFFFLRGKNIPLELPWLSTSYIGRLSNLLGFQTVTRTSLYLCAIISLAVVYYLTKVLKQRF